MIGAIFFVNALVKFSISWFDISFGLQIIPPFPPPSGKPRVAVLIVIHIARAETSSKLTCG